MARVPGAGSKAGTSFARRVLAVVRAIPAGRVATYGDVAVMAGRPRAHRAVGNIMRDCRTPGVPCHRVIGAGGVLGGFGGHSGLKRELLRAEGLTVVGQRVRGFSDARWAEDDDAASRSARRRASTVRSTTKK